MLLKIGAGLAAFVTLMIFMFAPVAVVRVLSGMPFNAQGPSWEIWLLVVGGGIGAGAGRLAHDLILRKGGGLGDREIEKNWRGR
jgi:hypothetical protein